MSKLFLTELEIEGFRSFANNTKITFPQRGMLLLDGKNFDSSIEGETSSGSGKSSIVLAVSAGFDYCPYPSTALQSWYSDKQYQLKFKLVTNDGEVEWTKGRSPKFQSPAKTVSGAKAVSQEIQNLTKLTPKMLSIITYREQDTGGMFLGMDDASKKDFLTTLLGLQRFEEQVEIAEEKVKDLENKLMVCNLQLQFIKDNLSSFMREKAANELQLIDLGSYNSQTKGLELQAGNFRTRIFELETSIKEQTEKNRVKADEFMLAQAALVQELETQIRQYDAQLKVPIKVDRAEHSRLVTLQNEAKVYYLQIVGENEAGVEDKNRQWRELNILSEKFVHKRNNVIKERLKLLGEMKELENSKCPTCSQQWVDARKKYEENKVKVAELEVEKATHQKDYNEIEQQMKELDKWRPNPLEGQLEEILKTLETQVRAEDSRLQALESNEFHGRRIQLMEARQRLDSTRNSIEQNIKNIIKIDSKLLIELDQNKLQLQQCENQLKDVRHAMSLAELQNQMQQSKYNDICSKILKAERELHLEQAKATTLTTELNAEKDLALFLGREGFLGSIFDEILMSISEETNRILANVPNVARCTFNFKSEYETSKGATKRKIVPVVRVNGNEGPYKATLSGGMKSALELAVDLAVGAIISRRTGSYPGWLILDEAFNGLNVIEKEACLQVLSQFAEERLIIVIDHDSTFKEMFQKVITVGYRNGVSFLME
jgi:DNA repair exonuclease SbcCD ATPase subunit